MNNYEFRQSILNYKFAPHLVMITYVLAFFSWLFLANETMLDFVAEFGIVENSTVGFYIIAVILIWIPAVTSRSNLLTRLSGSVILLSMALREADMHKYINGISMFKIKFWLGDYPLQDKIVTFIVILPILISIIFLFLNYHRDFFKQVSDRKPSVVTLLTFIVTTFVAKIFDRSVDVVTDFIDVRHEGVPLWITAFQNAFEEYLECLLPILIIIFLIQYINEYKAHQFN